MNLVVFYRGKKEKARFKKMMGLEVDNLLKQFTSKFRITQDLHETIVKRVQKKSFLIPEMEKKMTTFINNPKPKLILFWFCLAILL